jgi:galactokinase
MPSHTDPGKHKPIELFVPGRICLFGEHSDWAGGHRRDNPTIEKGYTLISGTDQGIYAEVQAHPLALMLTATTPDGETRGPREIPLDLQVLLQVARHGGFWSYIAGTAYQILLHHPVAGLRVHNYRTDLPLRKGLASSAAICVLTARAFNRVYDLGLTIREEMELAYLGETTTPSRCGRMDQGCAFGHRTVCMTFDGDCLDTSEVPVGHDLYLIIVDLQAQKDTHTILERLNRCYPRRKSAIARGVQELLGPINRRIVHQAMDALVAGDAQRLGTLMDEAQTLFDRYAVPACPDELVAPVLHRALSYSPLRPHVWGGKGVGSQGDGAAQFVARSEKAQQTAMALLEQDLGMRCLGLTLRPSPGAVKAVT